MFRLMINKICCAGYLRTVDKSEHDTLKGIVFMLEFYDGIIPLVIVMGLSYSPNFTFRC